MLYIRIHRISYISPEIIVADGLFFQLCHFIFLWQCMYIVFILQGHTVQNNC